MYHLIRNISFIIPFFILGQSVSQRNGNAWILGYDNDSTHIPKYGKTILNFSTGNVEINYTPGKKVPALGNLNSSIADSTGSLRYFTDGYRIYNSIQELIPGGDSLNYGEIWENFKDGFFYPTENNHFFLPYPNYENHRTVLFHLSPEYYSGLQTRSSYVPTFRMSEIVSDSFTGKSRVVFRDSIILRGDFNEFHMSCTKHANGRDWWIILEDYKTNNHKIFLFDPGGIHLKHNQSIGIAGDAYMWSGNSLFSPDGSKYIKYLSAYNIQVFNFDRCTGVLSNAKHIPTTYSSKNEFFNLAVSSNSRFLYFCSSLFLWQYDLNSENIKNSVELIGQWDGYLFKNKLPTSFYQMALADDGKIYISCRSSSIYLHVINSPNEHGTNCNFVLRGLKLPAYMFGGPPALPNYKLGSIDNSLCDSLGINNFPIAEFGYLQDSNQYLKIKFRDLSYHEPKEWQWEFEDLNYSTLISNDTSPYHNFPKVGIYKVCLRVKNSNGESSICKNLIIEPTVDQDTTNSKSIVSVYPNIIHDKFNLVINYYLPMDATLILFDELGRVVFYSKVRNGINSYNIDYLSKGLYYYSCTNEKKIISTGKLIKLDY
jgi:hypothetical protein